MFGFDYKCTQVFFFIAEYHYLIGINLANPKSAETWVQGHLNVNLHGSRGEIIQHELTPE